MRTLLLLLLALPLPGCATLGGVPLAVRNDSSRPVDGALTLHDARGEPVGEPFTFSLAPGEARELTRLRDGDAATARIALDDGRTAEERVGFTRDVVKVEIVIGDDAIAVAPQVR